MFHAFDSRSDEEKRAWHWQPAPAGRDIPCLCGALVDLSNKVNVCPGCHAEYDLYGAITKAGQWPLPRSAR